MKMLQRLSAVFCTFVISITTTTNTSMGSKFDNAIPQTNGFNNLNNYSESLTALADKDKSMAGKCGDNLTWVLDDEGTLTISGTGKMYNYSDGLELWNRWSNGYLKTAPEWFANRDKIVHIVIEEGVENIGNQAFKGLRKLETVIIPTSLKSIGYASFGFNEGYVSDAKLKYISYLGSKKQWNHININDERGAFGGFNNDVLNKTKIYFDGTVPHKEFEYCGEKTTFKGHDYQLFKSQYIESDDVITYCKETGGYWAHINDEEENEFLKELICKNDVKYAYFGYSDEEIEGKWQWIDGKTSQYTNWSAGEPNNEYGQEHYALINQNGYWNDGKFENDAANSGVVIICEFNTNTDVDMGDNTDTSNTSSDADGGESKSDYSNFNSNSSENDDNQSVPQTDTTSNNTTKDDVSNNANPGSNIITVPFKERNVDFYWNDDLFSESAFEYNNNLAIASLVLAGAAESKSDEDVKRVLNDMEFKDIMSSENYDCFNVFQPAYIIGSKKITVNDKEKTLISITIRGTTKFADIITDVADGAIGFNSSVLFVQNGLLEYVNKYFNSVDGDDVILWISGHSLGGAVASSLGAYINDAASIGNDLDWNTYRPENIYTYSFAPPSYTTITSILKQHKNIFETINCLDFIPDLGGPKSRHTGIIREFDPFEVRDYANYYKEYTQKDFVPYFSRFPSTDYHACLAYMAFLKSGGEPTTVRPQKRFFLSVCCPVDVEVYDSDGKLLSRVTNNICDENITSDNVICIINGDKKYFVISTDDKYQVKFTGTDNGTMEYSVQKLRSADEIITEEDFITYETVELENGKTFYSEIPSNDDIAEVTLYVVDPETNEPVKSVELDGKETNLTGKGYIWLYIVGAVLIVGVTVILVLISYKKHKKHSFSSRR